MWFLIKRADCKSKTLKWHCVHLVLAGESGSDVGEVPRSLGIGSVDSDCLKYLAGEWEAEGVGGI